MLSIGYVDRLGYVTFHHIASLVVALALVVAVACGNSRGDSVDAGCAGLETVPDHTGLISRDEAEGLATTQLTSSAPSITGMEIERLVASCLTTLRSYEQDLLGGGPQTNPEVLSPETPIWIVEAKGIARPAGLSAANADKPYQYGMATFDARNGETKRRSHYQEPLLQPAQ